VGPTGLPALLRSFLDSATDTLDITMYQLGNADMVDAIEDAARRGVEVRLIFDRDQWVNDNARPSLVAAGVEVHDSPAHFSHYHAKTIVVDGTRAIVMSANFNDYSLSGERNHGVILDDPWDIADLEEVFEHDWAGRASVLGLACTRLVLGPDNSRERITALINSATSSLKMQELSFSDSSIRAAVLGRAAAGVVVQVILADPEWITSNPTAAAELHDGGVAVRYLSAYDNHSKLIVADGDTAYVGSTNISYTSLTDNREAGVMLTDGPSVTELGSAFSSDWAISWDPFE
jgi:phosphatidylserine/phosphatidylglycerophosphate/cardiolipin synthase-like enzyme